MSISRFEVSRNVGGLIKKEAVSETERSQDHWVLTISGLVYHAPHLRFAASYDQSFFVLLKAVYSRTQERRIGISVMDLLNEVDIFFNRVETIIDIQSFFSEI